MDFGVLIQTPLMRMRIKDWRVTESRNGSGQAAFLRQFRMGGIP